MEVRWPYHAVAQGMSVAMTSPGSSMPVTYWTKGGKYGGYGTPARGG